MTNQSLEKVNIYACFSANTDFDFDQLGKGLSRNKTHKVYLACALAFFASSIRFNSTANHIFCTNLQQLPTIDGIDFQQILTDWGVKVKHLPFHYLPPKNLVNRFGNTLYKIDLFREIAQSGNEYNMIVDIDCVCIQNVLPLLELVKSGKMLLCDVKDTCTDLFPLYQKIDPQYPNPKPIHLGGGFMMGSKEQFIRCEVDSVWLMNRLKEFEVDNPPIFNNGMSIYEGDELFTSFTLNKFFSDYIDVSSTYKYLCIVGTVKEHYNVKPEMLQTMILHLYTEKSTGFQFLLPKLLDNTSEFWTLPLDKFPTYVGGFFGIPRRTHPHPIIWNLMLLRKEYRYMMKDLRRWQYELRTKLFKKK
jgi:hypothetical protein